MAGFLSKCKQYFSPSQDDSPRNNNFNIIRFAAAFLVIYGHMSALMGSWAFTLFSQAVSTIAVKIFFVISGYLVTKSLLSDTNFGRYMIRRCFRLFPALIVLVLVSAFIIGPIFSYLSPSEYFSHPHTYRYLLNIVLHPEYSLPGVFTDYVYPNAVNGSLWILPVEFLMYLILPAVMFIFKKLRCEKTGIIICMLGSLTLSILYIKFFRSSSFVVWGSDLFSMLPLIPFFFAGCLFTFPEFRKMLNLQFAIMLALVASVARVGEAFSEIIVFITVPYLTLSFALSEKPIFSAWFKHCDFSYGIFLWGFPIQQILNAKLARFGLSDFKMAIISFAVTLIPAILSWYLIEKPTQRLCQKWIKRLKERKEEKSAVKAGE